MKDSWEAHHLALGLQPGASAEDVRRAYKQLCLQCHPDRGGSTARMQQITAAREMLLGNALHPCITKECTGSSVKAYDVVRSIYSLGDALLSVDENAIAVLENAIGTSGRRCIYRATGGECLLCSCLLDRGDLLAVGTSLGKVCIIRTHGAPIDIDPDRDTLRAILVDTHDGVLEISLPGENGAVVALASATTSGLLIAATASGMTFLVDVDTQEVATPVAGSRSKELCVQADALAWHPTAPDCIIVGGSKIAAGAGTLMILLLTADEPADAGVANCEMLWEVQHSHPVFAVAVCDGEKASRAWVVAAAHGGSCTLHSGHDGTTLQRLDMSTGTIYALAFSPCGDCLIAAGSDEQVNVFNYPAGTRRAVLTLPTLATAKACSLNTAAINAVAFRDDCRIVSGGYDGAISSWQLEPRSVHNANTNEGRSWLALRLQKE